MPEETDWIEEPFAVEIKDGVALFTWPTGRRRAVPLRVFRIEHHRAGLALAEYDAHKAEVVVLRDRPRRRFKSGD